MLEIEVKVQVDHLEATQRTFEAMGCVFSVPKVQEDRVYIANDRSFPHLLPGDNALRIRTVTVGTITKYLFTLKQQTGNGLAKIEKETLIADPAQMYDICGLLGYKEVSFVKKIRRTTRYKNMEICLDEVVGLGNFIEVEQQVTLGNSDDLQQEMMQFLSSSGVDTTRRVTIGYDVLMREKEKN